MTRVRVKKIEVVCERLGCGRTKVLYPSQIKPFRFCSIPCRNTVLNTGQKCPWVSERLKRTNAELSRRTAAKRSATLKRRALENLAGGEFVSYEKYHSRHLHRVLAERTLGRKLRSDEIVHHMDGNKRNNALDNLTVMTRADHFRYHVRGEVMNNGLHLSTI